MSIGETLPFRSPISKLLRFFYRSRDKWKAKCKAAKRENKSLKYCLAKMKESRDRWKAEVRSLRKSLQAEAEPVAAEAKKRVQHGSRGHRCRYARSDVAAAR
jgi:F0F1-type ATP synthase membrane subunit b/b'